MAGTAVDLAAVRGADEGAPVAGLGESGVAEGAALLAYTEAVMAADAEAIGASRHRLAEAVGGDGVIEAAAVITMFNVVDRIADATGIPIDEGFTRELRYAIGSELGMDHLTPEQRARR